MRCLLTTQAEIQPVTDPAQSPKTIVVLFLTVGVVTAVSGLLFIVSQCSSDAETLESSKPHRECEGIQGMESFATQVLESGGMSIQVKVGNLSMDALADQIVSRLFPAAAWKRLVGDLSTGQPPSALIVKREAHFELVVSHFVRPMDFSGSSVVFRSIPRPDDEIKHRNLVVSEMLREGRITLLAIPYRGASSKVRGYVDSAGGERWKAEIENSRCKINLDVSREATRCSVQDFTEIIAEIASALDRELPRLMTVVEPLLQ